MAFWRRGDGHTDASVSPVPNLGCGGGGALPPQAASTSSTPIILAVVAVLLVTAMAGVLLVKK